MQTFIQFILNILVFSTKDISDAHIKNSELLRNFVADISDLLNVLEVFLLIKPVDN